jgi:rod shape determining protein RodA
MMKRFLGIDYIMLAAIAALGLLSISILYGMFGVGENTDIVVRQIVFVLIGLFVAFIVCLFKYDILRTFSTVIYLAGVFLLVLVLFIGTQINGTVGWIDLGIILVQPVEFAKVALIIFLAHFISRKRGELGELQTIFGSFVATLIYIGLTLRQPDAGSAMVLLVLWCGMIFVSGIKKRSIVVFIVACLFFSYGAWYILEPYQQDRITTFLNPQLDPKDSGYNVIQSLIAIGNGGLTGRGLGAGTQSQLDFLPEKHTDFIFASYTEAFGFVGAFFLIGLFMLVFFRLQRTAMKAVDVFGYFLCVGVTVLLFAHVAVNIGMNMALLPVTGIPLPFVSYGGSAMLSMCGAIGIVLSIYRTRQKVQAHLINESY